MKFIFNPLISNLNITQEFTNNMPWYGDGSDGDVTIPVGTTVSLARDMYYRNLTVSGNNTVLNTNGYRVFVSGILDITNSTGVAGIGKNGNNSPGATGGSVVLNQTVGGSVVAGGGGTGTSGAGGSGITAVAQTTTLGGASGASGAGGGLGAVGTAGVAATTAQDNKFSYFDTNILRGTALYTGGASAPGGSGGTGTSTNFGYVGGGGGSGGGVVAIFCNILKRDSTTVTDFIRSKGGNGGNSGTNTVTGSGGGGGGAGGGFILFVYNQLQGSVKTNLFSVSGGAGASGSNSGPGYFGSQGGQGGCAGQIVIINALTGQITEYDGRSTTATIPATPTSSTGTAGTAGVVLQASL